MSASARRLALFDLDHTPLDSDCQWADFMARTGWAGDPVATNPAPALRAHAQAQGWRVIHLFAEQPALDSLASA